MTTDLKQSDSSRALLQVLEADGAAAKLEEAAKQLGQKLHRTEIWRYSTGRVTPAADRAALLEDITGGAVKANGWVPDRDKPESPEVAPAPSFLPPAAGSR